MPNFAISVSSPGCEPLPPMRVIPRRPLGHRRGPGAHTAALHQLHGSPAAAIAFYDPRLGAVVVASHSQEWTVSQVVDVTLPAERPEGRR